MNNLTNYELHCLAAKSAGFTPIREGDERDGSVMLEGVQEPWQPLDDNGQAFRLGVEIRAFDDENFTLHLGRFCFKNPAASVTAAYRYAIVCVAAEKGRTG